MVKNIDLGLIDVGNLDAKKQRLF